MGNYIILSDIVDSHLYYYGSFSALYDKCIVSSILHQIRKSGNSMKLQHPYSRLPPLHALLKLRRPLPLIRFPEHIQMLMPYQVKIILLPEPFLPGAFHLPLHLDDILPENETRIKEAHQHPRRDWNEMLVAPRITHEDGAMLSRPEDAHALSRHPAHFILEFGNVMHA